MIWVDIVVNRTYEYDNTYFLYLIDKIAKSRIENGYLFLDLPDIALSKNALMAYLVSDLFYFGDRYILNFMAINILAIVYSGLSALIADKIFGGLAPGEATCSILSSNATTTSLVTISYDERYTGCFLVVLSVALILFSTTTLQNWSLALLSSFLST